MEEKKHRNNLIDIVRMFCAILVVGIHTRPFDSLDSSNLVGAIEKLNSIAVPMFLVIAGAFFWKKVEKTGIIYAKKYLGRIVTMYIFWSAIYAVYTYCVYYDFNTLSSFMKLLVCQLMYYGTYLHLWYFVCVIYCVILSIFALRCFKVSSVCRYIFPFIFLLYIVLYFVLGQQLPMEAKRILCNMPFFFLGTYTFSKNTKNHKEHTVVLLYVSLVGLILEWSFINIGYYPFSLFVFLPCLIRYMNLNEIVGLHLNWLGNYARITSSIMYSSHFLIILFLERVFDSSRGDLNFFITIVVELILGLLLSKCKWKGLKYII